MSQDVVRGTRITGIAPQSPSTISIVPIAYYRDRLGFALDFEYQSSYASVTPGRIRDTPQARVKLAGDRLHRKQNEHLDAHIAVSDIRGLYSELQMRGAEVIKPLEERPWACLDFYVEDPDGYILCFSELNV